MADVVGFTKESARRIAATVRLIERRPRGGDVPARGQIRPPHNLGARVAKVGGAAIGTMAGSNPGSGSGTLYDFNGTTLTAGDAITIFNLSTAGTIAASRWLIVVWIQGAWFADWEDC